ncbi:hypothetical protein T4D_14818 [Trichinella pseudospiralis]|uniref:Uncharacterized protein n=1 Tax=Trichinella pseudospiralis TaxID=6337 RepID=A0A0V1FVR7_TRIPS|nr:hypothetical protein T4D_14818 [Trichinella pseudospiralis]
MKIEFKFTSISETVKGHSCEKCLLKNAFHKQQSLLLCTSADIKRLNGGGGTKAAAETYCESKEKEKRKYTSFQKSGPLSRGITKKKKQNKELLSQMLIL